MKTRIIRWCLCWLCCFYCFGAGIVCAQSCLIKVCRGETGEDCGYRNTAGVMIIPFGKYEDCLSDSLCDFAVVREPIAFEYIMIDARGKKLFYAYLEDSVPDQFHEGLLRVRNRRGLAGYVNEKMKIVIPCRYAYADPFRNGKAWVAVFVKGHNPEGITHHLVINRRGKVVPWMK